MESEEIQHFESELNDYIEQGFELFKRMVQTDGNRLAIESFNLIEAMSEDHPEEGLKMKMRVIGGGLIESAEK